MCARVCPAGCRAEGQRCFRVPPVQSWGAGVSPHQAKETAGSSSLLSVQSQHILAG